MRSIAVINQKGGVGKTTSSVNLAAALADSGRRVCLMDLDPQAHASLHLGIAAVDGEAVSTSIAYLPEYMKLLGLQESSLGTFYRQTLLPRVAKQVTRLPRRVRALLEPGMVHAEPDT